VARCSFTHGCKPQACDTESSSFHSSLELIACITAYNFITALCHFPIGKWRGASSWYLCGWCTINAIKTQNIQSFDEFKCFRTFWFATIYIETDIELLFRIELHGPAPIENCGILELTLFDENNYAKRLSLSHTAVNASSLTMGGEAPPHRALCSAWLTSV
jgi:hypothetical protein